MIMTVRIGITASPTTIGDRPVDEVTRAYTTSVVRARGLPLILPVLDPAHVDDVVDVIDALVLSGGGDVTASCYGAEATPEIAGVDPARDDWEIALTLRALERDIPVLGICRGAQVLNVALGGTLIPHLPAVTDQVHRDEQRVDRPVHPVHVAPGSRLARAMGVTRTGVNSLHHQAVDGVATGLRAVAWSPDGIIEGIEGVADARVLGVQWHPELLPDVAGSPELFCWLIDQASRGHLVDATRSGHGMSLVDAVA
jgi:gamma-glutamyl-gamma-aminobutyrate hydrolase PuuD